jgi:cytidine deaminase
MNSIAEHLQSVLIKEAQSVRLRAHAPYSRFQVGAALLCQTGEIFVGCNVENVSFSLTICAERVAAATAIASGHNHWVAIAVASRGAVTPCGACRQFLAEFGNDMLVLSVDADSEEVRRFRLSELLPHAFDKKALDFGSE